MSGTLYVSAAGGEARLAQLDVLANNLANSETVGFRAGEVVFEAELDAALHDGEGAPEQGRAFVRVGEASVRGLSGPIRSTGRELDVAIQGDGFFAVDTAGGERFTRAGSFQVDPSGILVSLSGDPVLGEGGAISVGSRPVRIEADGSILDDEDQLVDRLRVVRFADASALAQEGGSLLRASGSDPGEPVEAPQLALRSLEGSNVQPVQDLARMIVVQRAFDAAMRTLESEDAASRRLLEEL